MRRILDLNQPGALLAKLIGLFVVIIPTVLYGALLFLNQAAIASILHGAMKISLALGGSIFVILLVLIVLEQIQDHVFDTQYRKNRGQKLPLANGNYECQYCGNQKVKANDKVCLVCGKELK